MIQSDNKLLRTRAIGYSPIVKYPQIKEDFEDFKIFGEITDKIINKKVYVKIKSRKKTIPGIWYNSKIYHKTIYEAVVINGNFVTKYGVIFKKSAEIVEKPKKFLKFDDAVLKQF